MEYFQKKYREEEIEWHCSLTDFDILWNLINEWEKTAYNEIEYLGKLGCHVLLVLLLMCFNMNVFLHKWQIIFFPMVDKMAI